jgi:hypothetical protein
VSFKSVRLADLSAALGIKTDPAAKAKNEGVTESAVVRFAGCGKKKKRTRTTGRENRKPYIYEETEGSIMFRKIALIAVPAMAVVLTLFASDNSSSQAFARGGRGGHGGHGFSRNHRGFNRNFRHNYRHGWNRYGWGYAGYGLEGYGYETPVCSTCAAEPVVAPVCPTCEPVAPVCATCEPVYSGFDGGYGGYFGGYGRYRNHYRNHGHFFGHGGHRGGGRRR